MASRRAPPPFRPGEHEWGQATVSAGESGRVAAELRAAAAADPPVGALADGVFSGF